jgi:hypothetical protein
MKDLNVYRFWGYAATFGALWGAVEITAGSFMHAVKMPFTGVMLAGIGASLLLALRTLLPKKGIVLAAGLVCASVKLFSPAGVVIGPMMAILVESVLVELVLLPVGAHPITGAMAGAVASFWSVTQSFITQTLLYGSPIIMIYKGILQQSVKILRLQPSGGAWLVCAFLCLVATIGGGLGLLGALVGRATRRQFVEQAT